MAKQVKRDGSRSEAVRKFLAANPDAKGNEVVEALATSGIVVTRGLVDQVRSVDSRKQKKSKKSRKMAVPVAAPEEPEEPVVPRSRYVAKRVTANQQVEVVVLARQLIDLLGGKKLKQLADLLDR